MIVLNVSTIQGYMYFIDICTVYCFNLIVFSRFYSIIVYYFYGYNVSFLFYKIYDTFFVISIDIDGSTFKFNLPILFYPGVLQLDIV